MVSSVLDVLERSSGFSGLGDEGNPQRVRSDLAGAVQLSSSRYSADHAPRLGLTHALTGLGDEQGLGVAVLGAVFDAADFGLGGVCGRVGALAPARVLRRGQGDNVFPSPCGRRGFCAALRGRRECRHRRWVAPEPRHPTKSILASRLRERRPAGGLVFDRFARGRCELA